MNIHASLYPVKNGHSEKPRESFDYWSLGGGGRGGGEEGRGN